MARIYTRSGDKGTTALIGGERVAKNDSRVEAYGTVDELGAHIALLTDWAAEAELGEMVTLLERVAVELMTVEAELALSEKFTGEIARVSPEMVTALEGDIDHLSEELPPFGGFTIPGGDKIISQCHICRTVCRRAERRILSAAEQFSVSEHLVGYINRLSDLLYTLSRWSTLRLGVEEKVWRK
jgi:cob(I)alamin adenosyltransferase